MPDAQELERAIKLLRLGEVVAIPTETVYGLAARIDMPRAVEKIFTTKERPFFDPLIVHVSHVDQAMKLTTEWGAIAQTLGEAFWPGPLTMVLPKSEEVSSVITAGLDTVGLRMPSHPLALELIDQLGIPLAAPSANKFGKTSPTSAFHVWQEFEKENVFILDGGECDIGIESTVVLVKQKTNELAILRRGYVLQADMEDALKSRGLDFKFVTAVSKKESPGHLKHHYMPAIPLVVSEKTEMTHAEVLIRTNTELVNLPNEIEGIKIVKPEGGIRTLAVLQLADDPVVAAREFYGELRRLAESGQDGILFYRQPIQTGELWEALFDRMYKAASLILS